MWTMKCVQYRWYLWQPPHNCVNITFFLSLHYLSASCDIIFTILPGHSGSLLMHLFIWDRVSVRVDLLLRKSRNSNYALTALIVTIWLSDFQLINETEHGSGCLRLNLSVNQDNSLTYMTRPRSVGQCLFWMSWNYPWNINSTLLHPVMSHWRKGVICHLKGERKMCRVSCWQHRQSCCSWGGGWWWAGSGRWPGWPLSSPRCLPRCPGPDPALRCPPAPRADTSQVSVSVGPRTRPQPRDLWQQWHAASSHSWLLNT